MDEDRITNLEDRIARLKRGFRLMPFALLAVIAVAAIVLVAAL